MPKINLSQQGNGKRAQQESTVEQRVYICSMHPRPQSKDEKLKNISKIINEYLQSLLKKYDLRWLLLGAWEPPWNLHAIRVANYTQI